MGGQVGACIKVTYVGRTSNLGTQRVVSKCLWKHPSWRGKLTLGGWLPAEWADNLGCLEIFWVSGQFILSNYNNLLF